MEKEYVPLLNNKFATLTEVVLWIEQPSFTPNVFGGSGYEFP